MAEIIMINTYGAVAQMDDTGKPGTFFLSKGRVSLGLDWKNLKHFLHQQKMIRNWKSVALPFDPLHHN